MEGGYGISILAFLHTSIRSKKCFARLVNEAIMVQCSRAVEVEYSDASRLALSDVPQQSTGSWSNGSIRLKLTWFSYFTADLASDLLFK